MGRCSESGLLFQKSCCSLELCQEAGRHTSTAFASVEAERFSQVFLSASMDRTRHSSSARRRASTSSRGNASTVPCSISASRRAAKASHSASRAASASRLATTRSSSRVRSGVGRRRTSDSRASNDVDMTAPREQDGERRSLPQALLDGALTPACKAGSATCATPTAGACASMYCGGSSWRARALRRSNAGASHRKAGPRRNQYIRNQGS